MSLKQPKKTILLTGGSAGIGQATAKMLMQQGYKVYAGSRSGCNNESDPTSGGEIIGLQLDITKPDDLNSAVRRVIDENGELYGVVCNAGAGIAGSIEKTSNDEARWLFEVNYFGTLNTIHACVPVLREQGFGRIIVISSVTAVAPIPFQGFYSSSKAAVSLLVQSLMLEVKQFGVQCCLINPGDVKTSFTQSRKYTAAAQDTTSPYLSHLKRAVSQMERDEQGGMAPEVIAKHICKQLSKKKMTPIVTPKLQYKILCAGINWAPCWLKLWVIDRMY